MSTIRKKQIIIAMKFPTLKNTKRNYRSKIKWVYSICYWNKNRGSNV